MKLKIFICVLIFLSSFAYAEVAQSDNIKIYYTFKPSNDLHSDNMKAVAVINPTARNDTKGVLYQKIVVPGAVAGNGGLIAAYESIKNVISVYSEKEFNLWIILLIILAIYLYFRRKRKDREDQERMLEEYRKKKYANYYPS